MKAERFSPREYLRARRPERFSDTAREERPDLDRSMLEYHLSTLTSRSQEVRFERFARRLAEREICPNLLPQTGPTGGGDSKVDSETYPVADDLSLGWYVGVGRKAASERWAFAFSAKEKWRGKVRSDVAKLASTQRGYRKAFFVSSQFIRDKARSEVEDDLSQKHNLDVRILDRNWILDRVFTGNHEELAIKELELTVHTQRKVLKGPLDMQRERELEETEKRIKDAGQQQRISHAAVDDCITSAILSRQLERPRFEIDGRFERAERIAAKHGTPHQRLECAYERAWTAFYWYEDFELFAELYQAVQDRAKGSRNPYHLELLSNLWFLLHTAVLEGWLGEAVELFPAATDTLSQELERLREEENRPSAALQAQTLLLLVQLILALAPREPIDQVLRDLQDVVQQCRGLAGYPLEPLVEILTSLGESLNGMPAYDELFETLVEVMSARKGEVSAARMLLKRSEQQLNADRPYDAIRVAGRAFGCLYKHESRQDCIHALYVCGCAYERVGLLWAARGTLLAAASLATDELWRYGNVTPAQALCYGRLKWLELQLGRLPHILAWHQADSAVRHYLVDQGYDESRLLEGSLEFDMSLGILLLKTGFAELERLSTLPDVLEGLGLSGASVALTYALGHEEELQDDEGAWAMEDMYSFFHQWRDQPASRDLPQSALLYDGDKVTLGSTLLGCGITVKSDSDSPCIELAESLLAALEGMLSTGTVEGMIARDPAFTMTVRKSESAKHPFEFDLQQRAGRSHIDIACCVFDPHNMSRETQGTIKENVLDILLAIITRLVLADDSVQLLERLLQDELALNRSVDFTGSFVTVGNVLGDDPRTKFSSWSDPQARNYPLKRSKAWDEEDSCTTKRSDSNRERSTLTPGEGDPPPDLLDLSRIKHTQIRTVSLIRTELWDDAKWCGTGFIVSGDMSVPPLLALVFENRESAEQILAQWRLELGTRDVNERLRVAIVRGISRRSPYSYRVIIGSNPDALDWLPNVERAFFVQRINTMEPESDLNLQRFLGSHKASGGYYLTMATQGTSLPEPELIRGYLIKRELHVRDAWEIGRHDIDCVGILKDDEPIIPCGQDNPPVLELLRWRREQA